jgi:hypothetical protein
MALRDKLRDRAQPFLEPGEQIQAVVPCQTGPSPWMSALSWLIVLFGAKFWIVVATDRNLVVLKSSAMSMKPTKLDRRLPRGTRFGPLSGLWGKSEVLGQKTYVHKRFHNDAAQADAMAGAAPVGAFPAAAAPAPAAAAEPAAATTPAGWYPDPDGGAGQRYWDGTAWTEHRA